MVQLSDTNPIQSRQLADVLGFNLSDAQIDRTLKQVEIQKPVAGKKFWQTDDTNKGVYIILEGKIRIFNSDNDLIATLEAGSSFGQSSLFPEASFNFYLARASIKVKLYYLSARLLQNLENEYPSIKEHLYQRASIDDLIFTCPQIASLRKKSGLIEVLSMLKKHEFLAGQLPSHLNQQKFWLLKQGHLRSASGCQVSQGSVYFPSPTETEWQIIQPIELYSLDETHWEIAVKFLPQLAELTNAEALSIQTKQQVRQNYVSLRATKRIPALDAESVSSSQTTRDRTNQNSDNVVRNDGQKVCKAYFPSPTLQVGHWWQRLTQRYPFLEQQSSSDCGIASLVMISRYWGKRFSIHRLRDIANVNRDGASLKGLVKAAESIGFTTRPVKTDLDILAQQDLPAIAHWEGKHYIVVYEITAKQVIVADPAIGRRSLTREQFTKDWTGYTLLLQPTSLLKETKDTKTSLWQFFELAKSHRTLLIEIFLASVVVQLLGLVTPLFTQLILDRVVVQRSSVTLNAVGLGLLIFGIFKIAMTGLRQYLLFHTANRIDLSLIVGFIAHTLRLPLSYFESRYVGDIISRIQENSKIQSFITGESLSIILDLLTVFVYLGLMFSYSWKMALLTFAILPPYLLLALIATPFLQRISREIFSAHNQETGYLIQALSGIRTIKSMAVEQTVRWHWEELFGNSIKKNFSGQMISNALQIFSSTIQTLISTAFLWFGASLVIQNELTIGQLVAFNMLLGNVITPFQRLIVLWNQLQEVVISVERINDVIDAEPEEDLQNQILQTLPPLDGHIRFDRVTFRYHPDNETNTLENLSFEVQPGQMVALVGRSGSGKTTISKLLLGFYPPTDGKILIDGYDSTSISLGSLRQQSGVVDQDTFLFGGTIRENIAIAYPEAPMEDIIDAATQAGAHNFIKELPMGYETQIGEGGGTLSGGQRQRLAIARALLGNPRLLVFDEATSSLDTESERIIQNNLSTICSNRTTFVIAHRLSTIRNADLILVLDKGILVEKGNHEELMAKRGQYFYLNQQQLTNVG
jgi:HlyB family type I secretion system ABC transporter